MNDDVGDVDVNDVDVDKDNLDGENSESATSRPNQQPWISDPTAIKCKSATIFFNQRPHGNQRPRINDHMVGTMFNKQKR